MRRGGLAWKDGREAVWCGAGVCSSRKSCRLAVDGQRSVTVSVRSWSFDWDLCIQHDRETRTNE